MEELMNIRYPGERDQPYCVGWSPDGTYLAFGDNALPHPTVQVWKIESRQPALVTTYRGHRDEVNGLAWSPDGTRIASGGMDGTVRVWEATTGAHLFTYRGHVREGTWVLDVAWSPDGTRIASAEGGHAEKEYAIQVWGATTGSSLLTYRGHSSAIYSLSWSPDSQRIASGSYDSTVQVWEAASGTLFARHQHPGWVHAVAWSPDGERIAVALDDYMVQIWDAETGAPNLTYQAHDGKLSLFPFAYIAALAWASDGKHLLTGSSDGVVLMCDTASGEFLLSEALDHSDRSHAEGVISLAWSTNGLIALTILDGSVRVWRPCHL